MEYYSTLKKKEILSYAATWMKVEDNMPEVRDKICVIPLYEGTVPRRVKLTETESRMGAAIG